VNTKFLTLQRIGARSGFRLLRPDIVHAGDITVSTIMTSKIIDDQDLSQVTYVGGWVRGGATKEYNGTVASTTRAGDYFTVTFEGIIRLLAAE
jgi:hypothetical protein